MKVVKTLAISLIIIFFLFISAIIIGYIRWEKIFSSNENITCTKMYDPKDLNLEDKIQTFILSESKTEFIVFSKEDILEILKNNLFLSEDIKIGEICLDSSLGLWKIYVQYTFQETTKAWIGYDIVKDNRETPEIYVNKIYLGGYELPKTMQSKIKVNINKGITDALILLNENRFLGREIINIELLEDKTVVRGKALLHNPIEYQISQ